MFSPEPFLVQLPLLLCSLAVLKVELFLAGLRFLLIEPPSSAVVLRYCRAGEA